jgi:GH15 family glucan-1,4-alpha-glucosidase
MRRVPTRIDGYAPIRDYAAIGNERSAALIALDGSIDWLCLPSLSSPSVLGALVDADSGGRFTLCPEEPFEAERKYLDGTNVLATTLVTTGGAVRVTDAMTIPEAGPLPWNELIRRMEGLSGETRLRWRFEPRFQWGADAGRLESRSGTAMALCGADIVTVHGFGMPEPLIRPGRIEGELVLQDGESALISLGGFHEEPVLISDRDAVERRLDETVDYWRRRADRVSYRGPWREAVVRSALALQLLVYGPTGAIAAAATTSLPERIGGDRNYDYRFAWLRDTGFTLEAMLRLGYNDQVHASLAWLLRTSRRTHPRLSVFYQLDGEPPVGQREVDFSGYRGSSPVVTGNDAAGQLQLSNYGDLLQTAWLYLSAGNALDPGSRIRLAEVADLVCELWRSPDASLWELDDRQDYTQGKFGAWLALDRAVRMARCGELPDDRVDHWERNAAEARRFVEEGCWSEDRGSYVRCCGSEGLDASVFLAARRKAGFFDPSDPRLAATIDAVRSELGRGPLLYRYSGMEDEEGAFLACSFWLVETLAHAGRLDEAADLMAELVDLGNDVGLYAEEMDPESGEFLGNFPQALTHLALVNAAYTLEETGG